MDAEIVGREAELEELNAFLDETRERPSALVLAGEAGIGKTALWRAGLEAAGGSFQRLVCRPTGAETQLGFAGLGDLLAEVGGTAIPALPAPQRHALEVALLLAESSGAPPDPRAIAAAFLTALRLLAREGPVLIAVDDVQWLDAQTAAVLGYSARRLEAEPVGMLLTQRNGGAAPLGLDRALAEERLRRLLVGPLSVGALHRLLQRRLGRAIARPTLIRIHQASGGNPFYAIELARALERRAGPLDPGEALPVPPTLEELVAQRLTGLPRPTLRMLSIVASLAEPTVALVERASQGQGHGLIDAAIEAGVLEAEGQRLRFSHPLLASGVDSLLRPQERRALHRSLAALVTEPEDRARHLALGVDGPDEEVAGKLDLAARLAARRGAPEAAAEFAEHAARLTPADCEGDVRRRLVEAAEHHIASGDPARGRAILEGLIARVAPGPERADLLWRLADAVGDDLAESIALCEQAQAEAGGDAALGARIETALGVFTWIAGDLARSAQHSRAAAKLGADAGDTLLVATALGEVCHAETVLGLGFRPKEMERALELEQQLEAFPPFMRPSYQVAVISVYTDELETARPLLLAELDRVAAAGDESARPGVLFRLADLELRAGNWTEAARHARHALALVLQAGIEQEQGVMLMVHALVQAHLGNAEEAHESGETALSLAEGAGDRVVAIRSLGTLGFLGLSRGQPEAALELLSPARAELESLGTGELSISQVVHNEIEALVALGRLDEAERTIAFVEEKGRPTGRSWHAAVSQRGRALVSAARGDYERARGHVEQALAAHTRLPQPFELGRTLLAQGSIERRAKHRRAARESLQEALAIFERLPAPLWAEKARDELARLGGRAPAGSELTATEQCVAELVARGHSNKEVAAALYVTPRTVESHLARIYVKLGVHSRGELARRLAASKVP